MPCVTAYATRSNALSTVSGSAAAGGDFVPDRSGPPVFAFAVFTIAVPCPRNHPTILSLFADAQWALYLGWSSSWTPLRLDFRCFEPGVPLNGEEMKLRDLSDSLR
jgi:hypothetical protein